MNDQPMRLAVLVTCYNRKPTTLRCLRALAESEEVAGTDRRVYLVDDGCSDGTAEAVLAEFPDTVILEGDGTLYWCGGMRLAWGRAMQDGHDCFLWLNDDTFIYRHAVADLLNTRREVLETLRSEPVIVGSCRDPDTGCCTYGGYRQRRRGLSLIEDRLPPKDHWFECDTMNGNLVLVPRAVVDRIGILSDQFTHFLGDQDYGHRAIEAGAPVIVAAGYLADCRRDVVPRPWMDSQLPLRQRWANMFTPKGLPPGEWLVYMRRHGGWLWPYHFAKPWIRVLVPGLFKCRSLRARHSLE